MTASGNLAAGVKARARAMGFDLVGITSVEPSAHGEYLRWWIDAGMHGEMAYLARAEATERRVDVRKTLEDARSVVVVGHQYFRQDRSDEEEDPTLAVVARYARGLDYHDVMKPRLLELLRWIRWRVGRPVEGRAYVDAGPLLERELGQRAGLGWFGKNTMLIHPRRGSYFFLGALIVNEPLLADEPFTRDHCGSCQRCILGCPTGALLGRAPGGGPIIDARLCISYLTIELRGAIPRHLRPLLGNRVFGCDICQEVCPWNRRFASLAAEPAYVEAGVLNGQTLVHLAGELLNMDEAGFRRRFRGSAILRARRVGLLRNVVVALGNLGSPDALPWLALALNDAEEVVRGHTAWALGASAMLPEARRLLTRRFDEERVPWVRQEITASLDAASV